MSHFTKSSKLAAINPARSFRIHLLVFLLTTPVIWLVWYITSRTYPWPLWSTPLWSIGVLFHFLGAFVFKKFKNN